MFLDAHDHAGAAAGLRILVVNGEVPARDGDSGSPRLFRILTLLIDEEHEVTLVARCGLGQEHAAAQLTAMGVDVFPVDRTRLRDVGAAVAGPDLDFAGLLADGAFDLAILSGSEIAEQYLPLLRAYSPLTSVVIDMVDEDGDALRELFSRAVRTPFVMPADAPDAEAAIAAYAGAFSTDDPVSLVLTVAPDQPGAAEVAFASAAAALERHGFDPETVADIQIAEATLVLPGRAVTIDGSPSAQRWRELARSRPAGRRARVRPRAAILVHAIDDAAMVGSQLAALERAGLGADVELVIAADASGAELETLLRRTGGARLVRGTQALGRQIAWQLAAEATSAPFAVALSPLAIPRPGFLEPLLDRLRAGAVLAGPTVDGAGGLRIAADGSLWPREEGEEGGPDALPFDCLAASRQLFCDGLPAFPRVEGHVEAQLAAWAAQHGALALAPRAHVDRLPAPAASVIVCTRNRAADLPGCVSLLLASGAEDVVIVDNASTDDTTEVAGELARRSGGRVRAVSEPRAGLSHARNAGAAAARHDLLLYIDDDARPGPGWLAHLAWTLARPGVVNAGGPISPLWLGPRPPGWPGRENEALLGVLDLGDAERSLMAPDVVYGGNWAVRRAALHAVGGFDPRFGVRPDARIGGEEVSVAWRLHEHGLGATIYAPGAAVGHLTPADRIDDLFLLRRSACVGIERPLHEQALGRADRDRLLASAAAAGRHLMELVPIRGNATVASALDELARADAPLSDRVRAANALGELAASVALLGEDQVLFGDMSLQIEREPLLRGIVTGPVPSIRT